MAFQGSEPPERPKAILGELSMAMELPIVLVAAVLMGGGGGYLLDRWLHTSPAFTLTGGVLGFGWGLWDVLRRLSRGRKPRGTRDGG